MARMIGLYCAQRFHPVISSEGCEVPSGAKPSFPR
jgi:hypothetical protein